MKTIIPALLAIVLLASCNQYKKSPSGFKYKISKGGSKDSLKHGQFVKMNIEYRLMPKDSVLGVSSFGHIPMYMMLDTNRKETYSFMEIITQVAPGDKINFLMSVDTLKNQNKLQYDNVFKQRGMIKGKVEVLKSFKSSTEAQADYEKELVAEKERETKALETYAAQKGIKVQRTASGLLVAVESAGSAVKGDTGTTVTVMYKGYFPDGVVFDSNTDPKKPSKPMVVAVGTQAVIPGFDESFKFFGKGGKGKVLIPAMLAYGQGGNPPVIPPYSNIIFDIEIVDIAVTPKQEPQPAPDAAMHR